MTVWGNGYPLYRIKCALGKCSSCITISRYARNDRVENEYPVHHTKNACETRSSRIVIPSEAEGSFSLAARGRVFGSEKRETPYRGKTVGGASYKRLGEGGGKRALSLIPKWQCGGMIPSYRIYLCLFRAPFMIDATRKWYRRISWKNEGRPKNDSMLFFTNGMQQMMGRKGVISKV